MVPENAPVAVAHGQDGGGQGRAVDLIGHIHKAGYLPCQHLLQVLLKQCALKEVPEVIARNVDLLLRAFGDIAAAPQKAADPLTAGGITLFLPELYLPGVAVQHHQLPDAHEVADGVDILPHCHRHLLAVDLHGDGHSLKCHVQPQLIRAAAVQILTDRLDALAAVYTHRGDHVAGADPAVADTDGLQLRRRQGTIVLSHGGGGEDHHVAPQQPSRRVGVAAVVEQAKTLLRLSVDVRHDALPIHGEHGMRRAVHHALQNVHTPTALRCVFIYLNGDHPP